jgi:hypothetical protein
MTEVSLIRLYALRALYLIMAIGQGAIQWPLLVHHAAPWSMMSGVAHAMLAALAAVALLGVRYPLKMLPLLFFELAWKALWLGAVALPLWRAGPLDADTMETVWACLLGVIVPFIVPWRYIVANYVWAPADRWR